MKVRAVFYGGLRQDTGVREELVEVAQDQLSVEELVAVLTMRFPALGSRLRAVAFVVNDTIVGPGYILADGDEAGLLPPVSGG
ncbi:MAG: MoaD/ThiS family protein [Anaerolineae bacterium]|nr:MoaD/ThiS family protein [Anaerolineae bacterium]